nr:helicase-primase primase subunite [Macronycteris gammaherpesvirus 1]
MSTEASENSSLSECKVVFGTDGDTAEILTNILTNADSVGNVFCLIHNCYSYNITGSNVLITLYLPVKRPGGSEKCLPVIQFKSDTATAMAFLFHGKSIDVKYIQSRLNLKAVKTFFRPIINLLSCNNSKAEKPHVDLKSTIYWFRAKFVVTLRKIFKVTASPYWMISTFGSFETQFILVSSCYFFESHDCTIDTLSHLSRLFEKNKGKPLTCINTFHDLSGMFGTSQWLALVPKFSQYVGKKLQRDDFESEAIDSTINTFRGQLMLSNKDLIHYIYLSFFQCLNKENFLQYSQHTNPENIDDAPSTSILTTFIDENFKTQMKTYYTKSSYLNTHVSVTYLELEETDGYFKETYNLNPLSGQQLEFWCGQSKDLQNLLSKIQVEFPWFNFSVDLQGLLDLAALNPRQDTEEVKEKLFSCAKRNPVYRCQYLNKTFFCVVNSDNLTSKWQKSISLPQGHGWHSMPDKEMTTSICYQDLFFSLPTIREQLGVSRHEYFNPRLPVFNLILDFDLPINKPGLSLDCIYSICLSIREDVISVMKLLGCVDERNHPVYFFKSSCPQLEWEVEGVKRPFCICVKKLGMRVVSPFPPGVMLIGSKPVIALAKILNRMLKMSKDIFAICPNILDIDGPFDYGIYHKGRCIRLPHTYKVNDTCGLERLLKIIVCHPHVLDKTVYIRDAMTLSSLLYHSKSNFWENEGKTTPPYQAVYDVTDLGEDFLLKQTQQQLPKSFEEVDNKIETLTGIDLVSWVSEVAWPKIFHTIKIYLPDDKTTQFHYVKFNQTSHNIIQLKPQRGNNFTCISLNHRSKNQGVRVFILLFSNKVEELTATFMSQCFANKCNNNKPRAHFSVVIPLNGEGK